MGGKVGLICGSCWSGKYTSGSGSVIGRDPLPPRAVSTSQLPQRALTQPPSVVSTLPVPRTNAGHRQSPLPVQKMAMQASRPPERTGVVNVDNVRTTISNADVRMGSAMVNDAKDSKMTSSGGGGQLRQEQPGQRLVSPAGPLRVISPNEHRLFSPNDSERHVHSPNERKVGSPIGRELDRTSGTNVRQRIVGRDSNELLNKRDKIQASVRSRLAL